MEVKIGACYPMYLLVLVGMWATNCFAVPPQARVNPNEQAMSAMQGSTVNGKGKMISLTTTAPSSNNKRPGEALAQRNKRDIVSESKGHFAMFPDVRNADDALQKLLLLLTMTKQKNTIAMDEYDEDFDNPPIDLVLGKEPGNVRSGMRKPKESKFVNGEEPTGVPIVLYQHHLNKKSSPSKVIPEIYVREAAPGSIYEADPKIMTNLLERYIFNRKVRSQIDGGRFYSVGHLLEHSSRLNNGIAAVPRLVL